ncbi:porin family protein [Legionella israelensis]|uniref:Porin family protein n=1 Tax=Legionella israelensis TaxID=454 RepID=A0AAX1EHR7_9GAMM|nr:outer membrane beta-barrel protein [Legionella israelensis]QBR84731.1 porin family protein [Legionella israelensis]
MKKIITLIALIFTSLLPTLILANGQNHSMENSIKPYFYAGGTLAFSSILDDNSSGNDPSTGAPIFFKQSKYNLGGGAFIGYQFKPHWATELSFTHIGNISYKITNAARRFVGTEDISQQNLVSLAGLYMINLNPRLAFYLRAGAGYYHLRDVSRLGPPLPRFIAKNTLNVLVFDYGVGFTVHVTDRIDARAGFVGLEAPDHFDTFQFINNFANIQLSYKFNAV